RHVAGVPVDVGGLGLGMGHAQASWNGPDRHQPPVAGRGPMVRRASPLFRLPGPLRAQTARPSARRARSATAKRPKPRARPVCNEAVRGAARAFAPPRSVNLEDLSMNPRSHSAAAIVSAGLLGAAAIITVAGPLDPPPGSVASTYKTLSEI